MEDDEARLLLGLASNSRPTPSEVKAAYKKKIWESHPDLFPAHEKPHAECRFKLISEAYACLLSGNPPDLCIKYKLKCFPRSHSWQTPKWATEIIEET